MSQVPQKDPNLRTWLRRPPGCTEMLTQRNPAGKPRAYVRDAPRPSAKRSRSRVRSRKQVFVKAGECSQGMSERRIAVVFTSWRPR